MPRSNEIRAWVKSGPKTHLPRPLPVVEQGVDQEFEELERAMEAHPDDSAANQLTELAVGRAAAVDARDNDLEVAALPRGVKYWLLRGNEKICSLRQDRVRRGGRGVPAPLLAAGFALPLLRPHAPRAPSAAPGAGAGRGSEAETQGFEVGRKEARL